MIAKTFFLAKTFHRPHGLLQNPLTVSNIETRPPERPGRNLPNAHLAWLE